jgi:hypothetical protein
VKKEEDGCNCSACIGLRDPTSIEVKIEEGSFGWALALMDASWRMQRKGWNGKGMWVTRCFSGSRFMESFLVMKTADGKFIPWLVSQTDLSAKDWQYFTEEQG